jgi:hypothetical protein
MAEPSLLFRLHVLNSQYDGQSNPGTKDLARHSDELVLPLISSMLFEIRREPKTYSLTGLTYENVQILSAQRQTERPFTLIRELQRHCIVDVIVFGSTFRDESVGVLQTT